MNNEFETVPVRAEAAVAGKRGAQLFRATYLCAVVVATIGWSIALGWGSLSVLRWFL